MYEEFSRIFWTLDSLDCFWTKTQLSGYSNTSFASTATGGHSWSFFKGKVKHLKGLDAACRFFGQFLGSSSKDSSLNVVTCASLTLTIQRDFLKHSWWCSIQFDHSLWCSSIHMVFIIEGMTWPKALSDLGKAPRVCGVPLMKLWGSKRAFKRSPWIQKIPTWSAIEGLNRHLTKVQSGENAPLQSFLDDIDCIISIAIWFIARSSPVLGASLLCRSSLLWLSCVVHSTV